MLLWLGQELSLVLCKLLALLIDSPEALELGVITSQLFRAWKEH